MIDEPPHDCGESSGSAAGIATKQREGSSPRSWPTVLLGALLVALVAVAFSPLRRAAFIMDDDVNITRNPTLLSPLGLVSMWFVPSSVDQYYPLMHTTFWIEYRLWGFDPLGYHVVNVVLHAVNVLLLWRLLVRLAVPGAWLAAAIFAVHPVVVETVAWAVERKNLLSMCLSLGSILCYLRFGLARRDDHHEAASAERWYAASLALFVLAMFSKTVVATLPAVLLVIVWWKKGRIHRRDIEPVVPFFFVSVALSIITVYQEAYQCGARGADFAWSLSDRFMVAGQALWFYAEKLVWPAPTMLFYPRFPQDAAQFLYALAAITVPVALWLARSRLGRGPLAAVLIFAGVLMPALGFFNVYYFLFTQVSDHFQYHACPALIALVTACATSLWRRIGSSRHGVPGAKMLGYVAIAVVILPLAARSYDACRLYESEEAIYRDVISKNPECWIAYCQLGVRLAVQQKFDEALAMEREAVRLAPGRARAHHNYASTILEQGEHTSLSAAQLDDAIAHFQRAVQINPELAAHHMGLGRALAQAERYAEAAPELSRAIEIEPQNVGAWWRLGCAQQQLADWERSCQTLKHAAQLMPNSPECRYSLGESYLALRNWRAAAKEFETTVQLMPDHLAAWNGLTTVSSELGDQARVLECLRHAAALDPSPEAQERLSQAEATSQAPPTRAADNTDSR